MRVLVIDNYDSFTYNLVQYLGELGCEIQVFRNDKIDLGELERQSFQRLIISPGPCTPDNAGISIDAIRQFGRAVPTLGVCLGHQAIGEAFGGRVVKAARPVHGFVSPIRHDSRSIYKDLPQDFAAARYHSLVIDERTLPDTLIVTSRSDDGVIMGVRHKKLPVEGVQFHPESILTTVGKRLLQNFVEGGVRS